jgi:hypothetical protein
MTLSATPILIALAVGVVAPATVLVASHFMGTEQTLLADAPPPIQPESIESPPSSSTLAWPTAPDTTTPAPTSTSNDVPSRPFVAAAPSASVREPISIDYAADASTPPPPASASTSAPPPSTSAPPVPLVACGNVTCPAGYSCCSASCGICTAPGEACTRQACGTQTYPNSVGCGRNTCNIGEVCCNESCGICAAPGDTCNQDKCSDGPTVPVSQACGLTTCNVGSVCCDATCGLCGAADECVNLHC